MLFSGGVKMYMDGSGGARTAWMHDDWNKNLTEVDTGNPGYPGDPPDEYRTMATDFHNAGVHVSTHAIGDQAIDWVVDTYAQALDGQAHQGPAPRHHSRQHADRPRQRRDGAPAARLRRRLSGGVGVVHVVDRRHLRRQLRPGAQPAA